MADQVDTRSPPTPLGKRFVRYMVGFGVGTGLGLAPYLGLLDIPLFRPLLSLIPSAIQDSAIPLSAALMGVLAVAIQWYSAESVSRKRLGSMFTTTLIVAGTTFILLTIVHTLTTVSMPIGGKYPELVIVGFSRPVKPPCTQEISDEECIKRVTMDPASISSFWGDGQIRMARLSLMFSYLAFTGSFGLLVGLVVLKEGLRRSARG